MLSGIEKFRTAKQEAAYLLRGEELRELRALQRGEGGHLLALHGGLHAALGQVVRVLQELLLSALPNAHELRRRPAQRMRSPSARSAPESDHESSA